MGIIVFVALAAAEPVLLALRPSAEVDGVLIRLRDIGAVLAAPEGTGPSIESIVIALARGTGPAIAIERAAVERRLAEEGIPDVALSGAEVVFVRIAARAETAPLGSAPRRRDADPKEGDRAKAYPRQADELLVLFRGRFVEISARGRPLRPGIPGEVVPVRLEGGRTVRARIEGPGRAVALSESQGKETP